MTWHNETLLRAISAAANEIEAAGRISDPLLAQLYSENAFSLLLPQSLGGQQLDFPGFLHIVQSIAREDGSVGWCVNQGSILCSLGYQLVDSSAQEIWDLPERAIANGPPAGPVSLTRARYGFILNGKWTFSSGINHARYLVGVAPVVDTAGKPTRDIRWCFFRKEQAIINNSWNVNGLKGTGSYGFAVTDLHIPEQMALKATLQTSGPALYRIPLNLLFACGFATVALGVARGALDFAIKRTQQKTKRFDQHTLSESAGTQSQIGRAEALWQSADTFLHATVNRVWGELSTNQALRDDHRISLRMVGTHVIRQCMDITDIAYAACSTDSIFRENEIQRRFQDMHVITQHVQGRIDTYGIVGRYHLGLPFEHVLIS